jgi:hypothetical protein
MFNSKHLILGSVLVALSLAQEPDLKPLPDVKPLCNQTIMAALNPPPNSECAIPKDRNEAYMDKMCLNIDKCITESKNNISNFCSDEKDNERVRHFHDYVVEVKFKSLCLKDNQNKYCRKEDSGPFCTECMPKRTALTDEIIKDAVSNKRSKKWQADHLGCNINNDGTVKSGPTSSNAMGAVSFGLIPILGCLFYLSLDI